MNQDIDTNNEYLDFDPDSMLQESVPPSKIEEEVPKKEPFKIHADVFWGFANPEAPEVKNFLFQRDLILNPLKTIHGLDGIFDIYVLKHFVDKHRNDNGIKMLIDLSYKTFGYNAVHTSNFYKNHCTLEINQIDSPLKLGSYSDSHYSSVVLTDQESIEKYLSLFANKMNQIQGDIIIDIYQGNSLLMDHRRIYQPSKYILCSDPLSLKFNITNS